MSDGMSDGRNYGPSLSKHGPPMVSQDGQPFEFDRKAVCRHQLVNCIGCERDFVLLQNARLKDMLNDIRGMAFTDAFSDLPSNLAAKILRRIEDGVTEKPKEG